jgi:hypothetical protein
MRKSLLCAAFASAFLGLGGTAPSAMPKSDRPSIENLAQPVVCVGNRRSYRNFNHCWAVNARTQSNNRWVASYCSRICSTGYDN